MRLMSERFVYRAIITSSLLLVLAACGGEDEDGVSEQPSPTAAQATTVPTVARDDLPAPVERALEAAANDAELNRSEVGLIGYAEETWSDTSLGCPQLDGVYAQVITPGYRVQVLVDGQELEYHTDMDGAVIRCNP